MGKSPVYSSIEGLFAEDQHSGSSDNKKKRMVAFDNLLLEQEDDPDLGKHNGDDNDESGNNEADSHVSHA